MTPPAEPTSTRDECNWKSELALAFETWRQNSDKYPTTTRERWEQQGLAHFFPRDEAQQKLSGVAIEVLSALAHQRYADLRQYLGPTGLCVRSGKGAGCRDLSPAELATCSTSKRSVEWTTSGAAGDRPLYTCGEAFRKIFYSRDFLRAKDVRYNCFPDRVRDKGATPIILSEPARGYVEVLDTDERGAQKTLWLVFDGPPEEPVLTELIAEY
jgi:hypothetical protein